MTTEAVRLAKLQAKREEMAWQREMLGKALTNPATTCILGCIAVEMLQRVSIGKIPAQPARFSWGVDIGFHPAKPAQDVRLISDVLGSAIEVGLIINLAGGLDTVANAFKVGVGSLAPIAGLIGTGGTV